MINWSALIPFIFITTLTPGPNNITSASMGMRFGYRRSLKFLLGIVCGFFAMLFLSGWLSNAIVRVLPQFELVLRIVGALYILWLAFETLRSTHAYELQEQQVLNFWKGFFLQLLNVKVIFFGLTIYTGFLQSLSGSFSWLILSAAGLATVGFCSISVWNLFGVAIQRYLKKPKLQKTVNLVLALLLVYTALEIAGLLP